MATQIGGCCLSTQIELELEDKGPDSNENAQFDKKNVQFIDFYHLNVDVHVKKNLTYGC